MRGIPIKYVRAAALIVHKQNVLLMKRVRKGYHYYSIPGGKVEPNETYEQACIREVIEECSLKIHVDKKLKDIIDQREDLKVRNIIFLCTYLSGNPSLSSKEKKLTSQDNFYKPIWIDIQKAKTFHYRSNWLKQLIDDL